MRRQARRWLLFALLLAIAVTVNLPIVLMVLNAFRTTSEITASRSVIPTGLHLTNFAFVSRETSYWSFFANSVIASAGSTVLGTIAAALAGYAMSRYRGRVLTGFSRLLLVVQMFPVIIALIPLFILFRKLGLVNNPLSVILIYAVVHLPFATWMFKSFFDTIPRELEQAAQVDGCTPMMALRRIVLPLSGPGTAAVVIFSFLFSYNEFFVASVFLRDEDVMTIPVGIQLFLQDNATDWGSLMAAATLTMVPTFVFLVFVQRYITYGAVAGGVKE